MKLSKVARFFDRVEVLDPDTLSPIFKCQIENFDGSRRDAYAAYRRMMSTGVESVIPASGAIRLWDQNWIVSYPHNDGWEEIHRVSYTLHQASGKAQVMSISQYLSREAGTEEWADSQWLVARKEEAYSSLSPQEYAIIMRAGAQAEQYSIVTLNGFTYLAKYTYLADSGFFLCVCFRQKYNEPLNAVFEDRKFNPAAGGYTNDGTRTVPVMLVRWQEFFQYEEQITSRYEHGDMTMLVRKSDPVGNGTAFHMAGRRWTVVNSQTEGGVVAVHVRPA